MTLAAPEKLPLELGPDVESGFDPGYLDWDGTVCFFADYTPREADVFPVGQPIRLGGFREGEWNAAYLLSTQVGGTTPDERFTWVLMDVTRDGTLLAYCKTAVKRIYLSGISIGRPPTPEARRQQCPATGPACSPLCPGLSR